MLSNLNAKFEDVLNFKVNDTKVSLVVDSGAFYDMMSKTHYDKLKGKIRLEKVFKKAHMRLGQCKARITVPEMSTETDFIIILHRYTIRLKI